MVIIMILEVDSMFFLNIVFILLKYDLLWIKNRMGYFLLLLVFLKKLMFKFSSEEKYYVVCFYFMN